MTTFATKSGVAQAAPAAPLLTALKTPWQSFTQPRSQAVGENGLATSMSSSCDLHCQKVGSTNQISEHCHMTTVKPKCIIH